MHTSQAVLAHQPGDPLATDAVPSTMQLTVNAWSAVGAHRRRVDLFDLHDQLGIGTVAG